MKGIAEVNEHREGGDTPRRGKMSNKQYIEFLTKQRQAKQSCILGGQEQANNSKNRYLRLSKINGE
jgi:hypothetical protein